jgi:hypothetical protein
VLPPVTTGNDGLNVGAVVDVPVGDEGEDGEEGELGDEGDEGCVGCVG